MPRINTAVCDCSNLYAVYVPQNIAIFCKEADSFASVICKKNPPADATKITEMQALNCLGLERNCSKNGTLFLCFGRH